MEKGFRQFYLLFVVVTFLKIPCSQADGSFLSPWVYKLPSGSKPAALAIGSFKKGTAGADLITANTGSGTLGLLLNAESGPPAPDTAGPALTGRTFLPKLMIYTIFVFDLSYASVAHPIPELMLDTFDIVLPACESMFSDES